LHGDSSQNRRSESGRHCSVQGEWISIVERIDGQLRVVEVGDGQVSDLVGWTPEQFAKILKGV